MELFERVMTVRNESDVLALAVIVTGVGTLALLGVIGPDVWSIG